MGKASKVVERNSRKKIIDSILEHCEEIENALALHPPSTPAIISLFMKRFALLAILALFSLTSLHAEIRGAWVASVWNINFPSSSGLSVEKQKAEMIRLLDSAAAARLNTILFQVRPESDALYASRLEPWSRFLTGKQGVSPGYDPLAFCIAEARKRGIAVHAWINPYRAVASAGKDVASNHISRRYPQYAYRIGSVIMMDPGAPAVQKHILDVVRDILTRYDVAGIHFDDYFYPYPGNTGKLPNFPDDKTYQAYRATGGKLDKAEWRRASVNTLIRRTHALVREVKPNAQFGVSPFGIYTKGTPKGIVAGVDQLNHLHCDSVSWLRNGTVDYLAPQLYWRDGGNQCFTTLLRWWRSPNVNPRRIPVIPGIAVERMRSQNWPRDEIAKKIRIERSTPPASGFFLYNIHDVVENTKGLRSVL